MMRLPAPLVELLGILRRAYPDEFPKEDYYPLLAVLQTDMSEENLASDVAEFLDDETVVMATTQPRPLPCQSPSEKRSLGCAADWKLPAGDLSWARTKAESR